MQVRIICGVALLALGACVKPMEITTKPVAASYAKGFDAARVSGSTTATMRSFVNEKEVSGAKCVARSNEVSVSYITPAKVILPTFTQSGKFAERGRPSALRVECKLGSQTGVQSFTAIDKQIGVATNAGVGGAILTAIVSGAMAASTPWRYPDLQHVSLTDLGKK